MLLKIIILALSLLLGYVRVNEAGSCNCGIPNRGRSWGRGIDPGFIKSRPGPNINGGRKTRGHTYPWIVTVEGGGCSGALISSRHVLTAAHCFFEGKTNRRKDTIGDIGYGSDKKYNTKSASVSQVEINPTFDNRRLSGSDTAIVTLTEPVTFGYYVRPLCLPANPSRQYEGQKAIAAGWGRTNKDQWGGSSVNKLKEARVRILSNRKCSRLRRRENKSYSKQFDLCTMGIRKHYHGTRKGDSGSVLFVRENKDEKRYTAVAVNSKDSIPDVFARITPEVYAWIEENSYGTTNSKCEAIN